MAFLVIAGIEVMTTSFAEDTSVLIGDEGRSFDGSLRGDYRAEKRVWKGTGLQTAAADYETLRSAVALGAQVSVSGTALPGGAARTMRVRLSGTAYQQDGLGYVLFPSFSLEDV